MRLQSAMANRPGSSVLRAEPHAPGAESDDAHQGRELRCPSLAHACQLASDRAIMPFRAPGDRTRSSERNEVRWSSLSGARAPHVVVWWWARGALHADIDKGV
jgi:hypothetical protein